MFSFTLKKLIARLFFPLPLGMEIILLGWWLTRKKKKFASQTYRKVGRVLILSGCIFLYLVSCSPFIDQIMYHFEHRYLPVQDNKLDIDYIVVLGGGHISDEFLPANSQISAWTLPRVVESVRLKKMFPLAKVIYSGGIINDAQSNALVMQKIAVMLGVPKEDIILNKKVFDTRDEAKALKNILKDKKFILVTSASHMWRAVALFKKYGLKPIPSPSPYLSKKTSGYLWWSYFPSYKGLQKSERLFYELLGMAWAKLMGYI
ncbi:ElyC/SanA/YdcF family protein [Desulfonauticus submarinus]